MQAAVSVLALLLGTQLLLQWFLSRGRDYVTGHAWVEQVN